MSSGEQYLTSGEIAAVRRGHQYLAEVRLAEAEAALDAAIWTDPENPDAAPATYAYAPDDQFTYKAAPEIEPLYAPAAEARPRAPEDAA
jgi:hypothetical protein